MAHLTIDTAAGPQIVRYDDGDPVITRLIEQGASFAINRQGYLDIVFVIDTYGLRRSLPRVMLSLDEPKRVPDFLDGDTLNLCRSNLAIITASEYSHRRVVAKRKALRAEQEAARQQRQRRYEPLTPRERALSQYYYDMIAATIGHEALAAWMQRTAPQMEEQ